MEAGPVSGLRPSNANVTDFELWIRMATDNKINANNSWNFALIDFFHDLSLLREGKSINFQKASATLDGCVKIYSSRVDSAATETGRLLSGLAASKYYKPNVEDDDDDDDDEKDEEDTEEVRVKQRKKNTVLESTLVNSFEQIRTKKIDFEFVVDPVFKKALSDFDEGGSKSLLLNMLSIDSTGRILFDTTSDSKTLAVDNTDETDIEKEFGIDDIDMPVNSVEVDINNLETLFFNNLEELDTFQYVRQWMLSKTSLLKVLTILTFSSKLKSKKPNMRMSIMTTMIMLVQYFLITMTTKSTTILVWDWVIIQ